MKVKNILLDQQAIERSLKRISHEIIEKNKGIENIVLFGIKTRGVPMAQRISNFIEEIEGIKIPVGTIDITFYRDDLTTICKTPILKSSKLDIETKNKKVIIVDDVLYTGRTARAAIECILNNGRANSIQLAILIDRGHRELPIRADYIGKNIPTSKDEIVSVCFKETDGNDCAILKYN